MKNIKENINALTINIQGPDDTNQIKEKDSSILSSASTASSTSRTSASPRQTSQTSTPTNIKMSLKNENENVKTFSQILSENQASSASRNKLERKPRNRKIIKHTQTNTIHQYFKKTNTTTMKRNFEKFSQEGQGQTDEFLQISPEISSSKKFKIENINNISSALLNGETGVSHNPTYSNLGNSTPQNEVILQEALFELNNEPGFESKSKCSTSSGQE